MNFSRFTCKLSFGQPFPASRLNPAFQGDALECEMEISNDAGAVVDKHKYDYLPNYGFSLLVETSNKTIDDTYTLKSVRFE